MRTKITQQRRDELTSILMRDGHIDSAEQAARCGVSHETIRKDLLYLEELGLAKKAYGGATLTVEPAEQSFSQKDVENRELKRRIASAAIAHIADGDTILLDSGSTVCALARLLAMRQMDVTVFTNSLKAAQILSEAGVRSFTLGGQVRASSGAITGSWAVNQLAEIRVQKVFLGCSGHEDRPGPCVESFEEAQIKRAMLQCADVRILLCDSSKARKRAMVQFAAWEDLDLLITDDGMDDEEKKRLLLRLRAMECV